jgi:hypothetical protein
MKSGHEYTLSEEQQLKVLELTTEMKEINCFVYEGYLFEGERIEVAKRFVAQNPSDSFWVWLHKKQRIIFAPESKEDYLKIKER